MKRLTICGALMVWLLVALQPVSSTSVPSPLPTPTSAPSPLPTPTGTREPSAIKLISLRAVSK
jgi:hypothetical protein